MADVVERGASSRWSLMERMFQIGCAIVVSSSHLAFSRERLLKLLSPTTSHQYLLDVLGVVLLLTVVGLVFRWIFAVFGEMRLLREYFHEQIRPQPGQVYLWAVLFSILLGALGSLADNIIAFSAVLAVYSVGDMWGRKLRDNQLKEALRQIRSKGGDPLLPGHQAIEHYYLERPQAERCATMMFFSFAALSLALTGNATHSPGKKEWLHAISYGIIVTNIGLSEVVIWRWRKTRDAVLGDKYSF